MKLKTTIVTSIAFVTLISTFFLSPAPVAKALDYDWDNIRWAGNSVGYDDSALNGTWRWELWQAKYTWSAAGADFYFSQATGSSPYYLYIGDTFDENAGAETQTSPLSWSDPYWIIEDTCYTVFNEDFSWSVGGGGGALDIETVALHEFGHWLRLEHCDNSESLVMYRNYTGVKTSLQQGDIDGIIAIYGEE